MPTLLALILASALGCSPENTLTGAAPTAPALSFTEPAAGAALARGTAQVWGSYSDMQSVTANGVETALSDGSWVGTAELVQGINLLEARGVGLDEDQRFERRAVLAGELADPDPPVRDAVIGRVNEPGLAQLIDLATGSMDIDALLGDLDALNPILEDTVVILGLDLADYSVTLDSLSFGELTIAADPRPGYLQLSVSLPDLLVDTTIHSDIFGWDPELGVGLSAGSVQVVADVFLSAEGGALAVDLGDVSVSMDDFVYDTSLLPDWIESWLFVDTIRQTIEDMLVEQISALVPPMVSDLISQFELSFELDLLGSPLSLSAEFSDASVDDDGIGLRADVDVSMPGDVGLDYPGYLSTHGSADPQLSTTAPISGALSDDLVNRLLFEVWRAGALELSIDSEDPELGPTVSFLLEMMGADTGSISVSAAMPPVMVERDGALNAQAGELMLTLDTPGGDLGESLTMALALWTELGLSMTDSCLQVDLGTPELSLMVRDSDWGASAEATTVLMEQLLPMDSLMATLKLLLGDGFCDLLPLQGVSIQEMTTTRDPDGGWSLLEIQLGPGTE